MVIVEIGREGVENALVVGVEPADFLGQHLLDDDGAQVDGTEREGLELQERPELALHVGRDEQGVLDAHAEAAGQVDAGLVGDGHTLYERGGLPLHAELVRTLVHAEVLAHAVARAMQVVQTLAPHVLAGEDVHLRAGSAAREDAAR